MDRYSETKLENGIRIVTEKIPHLDSATVCVWIMSGARDETGVPPGTAHMLEHMLFRGTGKRSGEEINRLIEGAGGEMNAVTGSEYMCFYAGTLKEKLEMAFALLAEILTEPLLSEEILEREKHVVYEEIRLHEENPEKFIFDALRMCSWGESELGKIETGKIEDVKKQRIEDLKTYINNHFLTKNLLVSASGNLAHDRVVEWVERYFRTLREGSAEKQRKKPEFLGMEKEFHGGEAQAHIGIGFEGLNFSHPDLFALKVLSVLLGGGTSSRLYRTIREKEGLGYAVFTHTQSYEDTGLLGIYAGVATKNIERGKQRILEEVRQVSEGSISEEEFQTAKNMLNGLFTRKLETSEARAFVLGEYAMRTGKIVTLEELKSRIENVKFEDVTRIANKLLKARYSCAVIRNQE
ncbi:MAG: pitrilysin family protein [Thermoplasmata archaeon]